MKTIFRSILALINLSLIWLAVGALCYFGLWCSGKPMERGEPMFIAFLLWVMLSTVLTIGACAPGDEKPTADGADGADSGGGA